MMVAAIWHNVLQPLNVSGEPGGSVDPLDVLTLVNEINNPKFSENGILDLVVPPGQVHPFFDVNCNSNIDALDVLTVVNAINSGVYDASWNFAASNNATVSSGRVTISACSPMLIEGDSLATQLHQTVVLPDETSAIRVSFEAPVFDSVSREAIRDAFEIVLLDSSGQPLSLPYGENREAIYNWSENTVPVVGPAAKMTTLPSGSISTATFNLTGLPSGTRVQVVVRLVNNDNDVNSSVVIRRVEIADIAELAPTGMSVPSSLQASFEPIVPGLLTDVSPSVRPIYGRTTLVEDEDIVVTDLQMINQGSNALSGRIVVAIDNLSDPSIGVMHPDGFLPGGRPYFVLNGTTATGWLASGETTAVRELRFKNPNRLQFTYTLTTLAELNSPPSGFTSLPLLQIESGKTYRTIAQAEDLDKQALIYSIAAGPVGMTIDPTSGQIIWITNPPDVGNHSVVLRATDPFGLSVQQSFTIAVLENLPNRPPVFTSTPPTDAVITAPFEVLTYKTGNDPVAVTAGNFGTGTSFVTANRGDSMLGFLGKDRVATSLGVGEPNPSSFKTSFVSPVPVDLGFHPNTYQSIERDLSGMVTADVNADGTPDLIFLASTGGSVGDYTDPNRVGRIGVRLGNGDGTFRPGWEATLPAVANRSSAAFGLHYVDVTGDGVQDLVATQYLGKTVLAYKGIAGGIFENVPVVSAYGGSSSLMQVADFNADGKTDIVLFENNPGGFRAGLSVLLGNGDGSFASETFYAGANDNSGPGYVVDVDGVNGPDLVRINYTDTRLEVRLNDGNGLFGATIASTVFAYASDGVTQANASPISAYFGDFDGDSKIDVSVSTATLGLFFLKGSGTGMFGDGTVAGNRSNSPIFSVTGTNTFPTTYYHDGKAFDFNADGKLDVVYGDSQNPYVTIGLGRGDGTFMLRSYNAQFIDDIGIGSVRGDRPTYLVNVADYNRDGVLDIGIGSQRNSNRPGSAAVILGDQVGTLRASLVVPFDKSGFGGPTVFDDFTGDGIDDIAMHNGDGIAVAVGRSDGTFADYQMGLINAGAATSIVSADFDRDGNLDLAWQSFSSNTVISFQAFGLGNGFFQLLPGIVVPDGLFMGRGLSEQEIIAADLNGDGHPDLAYRATDSRGPGEPTGGTFTRIDVLLYDPATNRFNLLADPDNLLGPLPRRRGYYYDEPLGFADLDGDGKGELFAHSVSIVGGTERPDSPERLYVWKPTLNPLGTDAKQLFTRTEIASPRLAGNALNEGDSIAGFVVADFNSDGNPDIAASTRSTATYVSYGNGDLTFKNPTAYLTNSFAINKGDINGDGLTDLITSWPGFGNSNQRQLTSVLPGRSDGTFGTPEPLATIFGNSTALAVGDFNLDGRGDFVTFSSSLYSEVFLAAPPSLVQVQSGDINGDGKLDLVGITTSFNRVKVLFGNGDDTFSRQSDLFVGASPVDLKLADINGDGQLDIITANRIGQSISVLTNHNGTFTRRDIAIDARPNRIAVSDITSDNHLDVVAISEVGQVLSVIVNSATGLGSATASVLGFAPGGLAMADVTGDGKVDAVITDPVNKRLFLLPGREDGSFGSATTIQLSHAPVDIAIADMNFDGKLDINITLPDSDQVALLFNRGGGRFTSPQSIKVGDGPNSIFVKDVNSDNKPDLLVTNGGDETLSVILNRFDFDKLYRYTPTAIDPDGDPISFDFETTPGGMFFDDATGQVLWAPMPDQIGNNVVALRASDNRGGAATQGFTIAVTAPTTTMPPVFTSQPLTAIPIDATFSYQPSNTNPGDNPVRYSLVTGPEGMTIDPTNGEVSWDPRNPGLSLALPRPDLGPAVVLGRGRIITADAPNLHSASVTAEGWFRFDSNNAFMALLQKPLSDINFNYAASWSLENAGGGIRARVGDGIDSALISAPMAMDLNVWTHLAMTFHDATRELTLYVNGVAVANTVAARPIAYDSSPLTIGRVENILATLTGIRVWNVARTASEIAAGMNAELPSDSPGLVVNYSFEGGPAAASFLDLSSSQNHGFVSSLIDLYNYPTRVPTLSFAAKHAVTIQVEDGKGGVGTQSFSIDIVSQQRGAVSGTVRDSITQTGLSDWTIFVDANRNNYRDAGETFTTTNALGGYSLHNLLATITPVAIEARSGFASPAVREVSVIPGQTTTSDFQVKAADPAIIRGRVAVDETTKAISGFTVYVDANGNSVWDSGELHSMTDRLGEYVLTGLHAGSYSVRVETPAGWKVVTPSNGSIVVSLAPNAISIGNDFTLMASSEAASIPRFVSTPLGSAMARSQFRYPAVAIDSLDRPITYSLLSGPSTMAVDAKSGVLVWTPSANDIGSIRVILKASNDGGQIAIQDFSLNVLAANSAPIITSDATFSAVATFPLRFDVLAQDAEQSTLSYSLASAPSGMSIDNETGRISWTPTFQQTGLQAAIVQTNDGVGGETRQTIDFNVASASVNGMPTITRGPRSSGQVGRNYVGRVSAEDIDKNPLTFSMVHGPTGMTITDDGRLNWLPSSAQSGNNPLRVRVEDGRGGSDEQDFTIAIDSQLINHAPTLTPVAPALGVVDKIFAEDLFASDVDGDAIAYQLISGPSGLSLDSTRGTLRWQPARDQLGVHSVTVRVVDPFGGFDEHGFNIAIRSVGGPPAILSVPPTMAAIGQTYIYSVQAADADEDPLTYSLSASPSGMGIDSTTGIIAWTPNTIQIGLQSVIVRVGDGAGGFTTQSFSIDVTTGVLNQAPLTSTQPILDAIVGVPYAYTLLATDPERGAITYAVRRGPVGLSINSSTGVVTWTPTAADLGTTVVVLTATDPDGAAGVQSLLVHVQASNHAPVIVSSAPAKVSQGGLYRYDVIANDRDREPLTYELVSGPAGLTLDSLGRVKWQTALDTPLGVRTATFTVRDGRGGSDTQTIQFDVVADTRPPRISIVIQNGILYPWSTEPAIVKVTATDDVGVTNITLSLDGKLVALAPDGTTSVFFGGLGRLEAFAYDAAGNRGRGVAQVRMRSGTEDGSNNGATTPTALIHSLHDGDLVGGFVSIVGTAAGVLPTDNVSYILSYRRGEEDAFHEISRGTGSVTDGVLGKWDTTLLENDEYVFKLEVTDSFGNFAAVERQVGVSGNFKLGNFRLSFVDITIPVAGIPITLARTYDTLRADRDSELGFGWSLEFRNANLRTGLAKSGLEDLGIYTAFKPGTKVYLTLPGGAREGFTFTPDIRALGGFGNTLVIATPRFTPDRGVRNSLTVRSGTYIVNPNGELVSGGGQPYNPAAEEFGGGYTVTTPEGIRYHIDGNTGMLTTAADRNNNTLTFTDAGISGPGDTTLKFERDAKGRITQAIDPAGSSLQYEYDTLGNLSQVTDRTGNATRYQYKTTPAHYLESVVDPLGRTGARVEYGPDGRLSASIDALGNRGTVSYDTASSLVTTRDALGQPTVTEYDPNGNVVVVTDTLGGVTRSTFDADDRRTSFTDPLGNTTRYFYDDLGQQVKMIDPFGHATQSTYTVSGLTASSVDATGRTFTFTYDSVGNLTSSKDPTGRVSSTVFDSYGNALSVNDGAGGYTSNAYDNAGRMLSTRGPDGITSEFTYDLIGRLTVTKSRSQGQDGKVLTEVTTATYDASGRVLAVADTLGRSIQSTYDANGQLIATTDPAGRVTSFTYDASGRQISVLYPDGSSSYTSYDAVGRMIASTDTAGRISRIQRDALGRIVATIAPDDTLDQADNPRITTEYDAAGRVISSTDALGNSTKYTYDAAGNLLTTIDPLGKVTSSTFDELNRVVASTDSSGAMTHFTYDTLGYIVSSTLPDGSVKKTSYTPNGNISTAFDATGAVTSYTYDSANRLVAVTDALGNVSRFAYDAFGRLREQSDANGHMTLTEYDGLGRRIAVVTPLGRRSEYSYDLSGNVVKVVDEGGEVTRFDYDVRNRLILTQFPDDTSVSVNYTSGGERAAVTDTRGTTSYAYDAAGRLLSRTEPDGQSVHYSYNRNDAVITVSTLAGTTSYSYNEAGEIAYTTGPTGHTTNYTYTPSGAIATIGSHELTERRTVDALGRLTIQTLIGPLGKLREFSYAYDAASRRISERADDGRTVAFSYDLVGRLIREQIREADGSFRSIRYSYDPAGNRLKREDSVDGTTISVYDVDDRLLADTTNGAVTSYLYDAAGNLIRKDAGASGVSLYTYDSLRRLKSATVAAGNTTQTIVYAYDADRRLVGRTADGLEVRYLRDDNRLSNVLAEYRPDGTLLAAMSYGHGLTLESRDGVSTIPFADMLGSVRLRLDVTGAETQMLNYDAFGRSLAGTTGESAGYAGLIADPLSGLYSMRSRVYDPNTGRFTSRDTAAGSLMIPISLHRYAYAHQNPSTFTDPSGRSLLGEQAFGVTLRSILTRGIFAGVISGSFGGVGAGVDAALGGERDPLALLKASAGGAASGFALGALLGPQFTGLGLAGQRLVAGVLLGSGSVEAWRAKTYPQFIFRALSLAVGLKSFTSLGKRANINPASETTTYYEVRGASAPPPPTPAAVEQAFVIRPNPDAGGSFPGLISLRTLQDARLTAASLRNGGELYILNPGERLQGSLLTGDQIQATIRFTPGELVPSIGPARRLTPSPPVFDADGFIL